MERALVDQLRESVFKGRSAVYQPRWVQGSSSNKGQEIPVGYVPAQEEPDVGASLGSFGGLLEGRLPALNLPLGPRSARTPRPP